MLRQNANIILKSQIIFGDINSVRSHLKLLNESLQK